MDMKHVLVCLLLMTLFKVCLAEDKHYTSSEDLNAQINNYLKSQNLPLSNSGIQIVPAQTLFASPAVKNKDFAMLYEQKKNGYVEEENPRAKELLEFKHIASYQYKKFANALDPESTQLRHSTEELKMEYAFRGVPKDLMSHFTGVAPFGAFHEGGWDGAVQFFENNETGSCAYTEHNLQLSHGGARLAKEAVTYEVNNKPTLLLVKGSKNAGFVYEVNWFDNLFAHTLECANRTYDLTITKNVVQLANKIDNNT